MTAAADAMTVIEVKPHAWGWKVFEAPGVEPVFREKGQPPHRQRRHLD